MFPTSFIDHVPDDLPMKAEEQKEEETKVRKCCNVLLLLNSNFYYTCACRLSRPLLLLVNQCLPLASVRHSLIMSPIILETLPLLLERR